MRGSGTTNSIGPLPITHQRAVGRTNVVSTSARTNATSMAAKLNP